MSYYGYLCLKRQRKAKFYFMTVKNRAVSSQEMDRQKEYTERIRRANDEYLLANGKRRRAFVLTLGCQQNEADSERLMGMAIEMGYEKTETPEDASLIMVNTCAIREHAEKRALSLVGQYKHIKARNFQVLTCIRYLKAKRKTMDWINFSMVYMLLQKL